MCLVPARWLHRTALVLGLACREPSPPAAEPAPPREQAPRPVPPAPPVEVGELVYAPGPNGVADATFTEWPVGARLSVGVDDTKLRAAPSPDAAVIAELPLASEVQVLGPASEPLELVGRRNRWVRVLAAGGTEGVLFGAALTPHAGFEQGGKMRWGLTFSPEFRPRLRVQVDGRVQSLDVLLPGDFRGGALFGNDDLVYYSGQQLEVLGCRVGPHPRACATARVKVDLRPDGFVLVQVTSPDAKEPAEEIDTACGPDVRILPLTPIPRQEIQAIEIPASEEEGPDTDIRCFAFGTVPLEGRTATAAACRLRYPGKTEAPSVGFQHFLVEGRTWTDLRCTNGRSEVGRPILVALAEQGLTTRIDTSVKLPPVAASVGGGAAPFAWQTPEEAPLDRMRVLFVDPVAGPVYTAVAPDDGSPVLAGALAVPRPEGATLLYAWKVEGPVQLDDPAAPVRSYTSQELGCSSTTVVWLTNVETGVTAADLERVGALQGLPVSALRDPKHPVNLRLLAEWQGKDPAQYPNLPDRSPDVLLPTRPWLFVQDPWGRVVRLMRDDLRMANMCEPMLYTWSDPPTAMRITAGPGLRITRSWPPYDGGWSVVAQPDGAALIDGERHPRLFWEGRSYWFAPPSEADVVAGADVEAYLRDGGASRGLVGRELDEFVDAWAPRLAPHSFVRIGWFDPAEVDRVAPLRIEPEPDLLLRVWMEATPTTGPATPLSPVAPPPERHGRVVAEWGGILR